MKQHGHGMDPGLYNLLIKMYAVEELKKEEGTLQYVFISVFFFVFHFRLTFICYFFCLGIIYLLTVRCIQQLELLEAAEPGRVDIQRYGEDESFAEPRDVQHSD
jgi:hypothetical protein